MDGISGCVFDSPLGFFREWYLALAFSSSELWPSTSAADTDTDAAAPAPASVSEAAPSERAAFVLPALDRNVGRICKVNAEVDAAFPLSVAPLSGDRKPE